MECSKLFLILIALFGVIVLTDAIVCPANYCETHTCDVVTSCPVGSKLKEHSGFCGCCTTCIRQIPSGDPCPIQFSGSPPVAECASGLGCAIENGSSVCQ